MSKDEAFVKRLAVIAKLVGFDLDVDVLELYDKHLAPIGYERLCAALDSIIGELGPGGPFPSIRQIKEVATGDRKADAPRLDDGAARIAAALVIQAVAQFGSIVGDGPNSTARLEKLKAFVGELGWESVRAFGNWNNLCSTLTYENTGTIQAQLREYARARIDRKALGIDATPPGLSSHSRPASGALAAVSASDAANAVATLVGPRRGEP